MADNHNGDAGLVILLFGGFVVLLYLAIIGILYMIAPPNVTPWPYKEGCIQVIKDDRLGFNQGIYCVVEVTVP